MRHFFKGAPYELIVPLLQELKGITIPELYCLKLPKDLGVDNAEIVIDGLVEDHVVNVGVYYFTHCAQSFDTVYVDVLEDLVYFVRPHFNFVDKHS